MWGRLEFAYEVLNRTMPNQIPLNWTMQSQTKACITKLSCADKQENRALVKLTDTTSSLSLSLFLCPPYTFFPRTTTLQKPSQYPSSGKEVPNLVDTLDRAILSHWAPYTQ
jgi:hypothetical protein